MTNLDRSLDSSGVQGTGMSEKILTIACNILVFGLAFLMLRLPYQFSLTLVVFVIAALLYMEKSGAINAVFALYIRNKAPAAWSAVICMLAVPLL
ncbi:MAG: hypothetical protein LBG29_10075, partial [Synergistaceae bacterium]|nr:hypothetical protein [Synergistaceae bacterium]